MGMTKHFIEFCDHIFPIESVVCIERFSNYIRNNGDKKIWKSVIYFDTGISFTFPESEYEKIKNIVTEFNSKLI